MHTHYKVLVIGAGTMGKGIAQTIATARDEVFLYDSIPQAARNAKESIGQSLARAAAKGYLPQDSIEETLNHLRPVADLREVAEAQVVMEAVKEDLTIKQNVFCEIEKIVSPNTLLCTNTSMLSISQIAAPLSRPQRFCGMHFFNPVPRMRLVEIIAGEQTSFATAEHATQIAARWGKTPVQAPDAPGFIVNRILDGIKREALALLDLGVPAEQIDTAVKLGLNFPMGPLELMDLIGLDTTLATLETQAQAMGRPITKPTQLHELVAERKLGRKSGIGFYDYRE